MQIKTDKNCPACGRQAIFCDTNANYYVCNSCYETWAVGPGDSEYEPADEITVIRCDWCDRNLTVPDDYELELMPDDKSPNDGTHGYCGLCGVLIVNSEIDLNVII